MVLVSFTIRMEECMKASGGSTECKAKASFTINLASWPTKVIGSTISSKATGSYTTNTLK